MSIDWFRSWHGAPTDTKWLLIAKRAGVAAGMVSAVAWALFDHASQAEQRGNLADFDVETYSIFSGFDESHIAAIIKAMEEKSIIENGHLTAWKKRQPKREDNSTERVTKHRVTQCNAVKRSETQSNSREEKNREREDRKDARARDFGDWPSDFEDQFWTLFPNKVGKQDALTKLNRVKQSGVSWRSLSDGLASYIRTKPPDRPWCNPATFLNQGRWEDQPANIVPIRRTPDV